MHDRHIWIASIFYPFMPMVSQPKVRLCALAVSRPAQVHRRKEVASQSTDRRRAACKACETARLSELLCPTLGIEWSSDL